jgi:cell pole-organizing protein PopZ
MPAEAGGKRGRAMALKETQPEPSMEEILASIRRIISEEEDGGAEAAPPEPALDLNEHAPAADDLMVFDEEEAIAEPAPAAAAPAPQHFALPAMVEEPEEAILSHGSTSATAGALTRLAGSLRVAEREGQTIEGVVRELLRPMLKDWLDENLPRIVEARVEAELERIARLVR